MLKSLFAIKAWLTRSKLHTMKKEIINFNWRQIIPLEEGFNSPGYRLLNDWEKIGLPVNLSGKTFLDVGSNDGFYSFEAENRGAKEVYAADLYKTNVINGSSAGTGWPIEGIELAKTFKKSTINIKSISVYNLNDLGQKFDYVFVSDVLSWLSDINLAIKVLSDVTENTLIIRDGFINEHNEQPYLRYEVDKPFLYRPNKKFIETLLLENGFKSVEFKKVILTDEEIFPFPVYEIKKGAKIYEFYDSTAEIDTLPSAKKMICSFDYNNRYKFRNLGWIDKDDVAKVKQRSSLAVKILKVTLGKKYALTKAKWLERKKTVTTYSVIAKKSI